MKKFEKQELSSNDTWVTEMGVTILRILLTPIFLFVRIYYWVWDYDYASWL